MLNDIHQGTRAGGGASAPLSFAPEPWMKDALCAQTDPEAFYPEKGESVRAAKAVCRQCPVIAECLAYALQTREPHGVWGGCSTKERRALLPPLKSCEGCGEEFEDPSPKRNTLRCFLCAQQVRQQQKSNHDKMRRAA